MWRFDSSRCHQILAGFVLSFVVSLCLLNPSHKRQHFSIIFCYKMYITVGLIHVNPLHVGFLRAEMAIL